MYQYTFIFFEKIRVVLCSVWSRQRRWRLPRPRLHRRRHVVGVIMSLCRSVCVWILILYFFIFLEGEGGGGGGCVVLFVLVLFDKRLVVNWCRYFNLLLFGSRCIHVLFFMCQAYLPTALLNRFRAATPAADAAVRVRDYEIAFDSLASRTQWVATVQRLLEAAAVGATMSE